MQNFWTLKLKIKNLQNVFYENLHKIDNIKFYGQIQLFSLSDGPHFSSKKGIFLNDFTSKGFIFDVNFTP